jgi:hypothetical protein
MYQKDYILRLIEQIARFLAEVMRLIKKGEYGEASSQLENSYYNFLKEDAAFFRNIPEKELTDKLLQEHNYTNDHLEILAELFNAEAELGQAKGNTKESLEYSRKALVLFEFVDRELKTYSAERLKKIEEIRNRLKQLN